MIYKCKFCEYNTKHKSHFNNHLNKKKLCKSIVIELDKDSIKTFENDAFKINNLKPKEMEGLEEEEEEEKEEEEDSSSDEEIIVYVKRKPKEIKPPVPVPVPGRNRIMFC